MENSRPNQHLRKSPGIGGTRSQSGNQWLDRLDTGLGKLPPQATDLEMAVLGALMIEKDALSAVIDILKAESFYKESHQRIYNAILMLFQNSEPIDLLTVTQQLRKTGELEFVGGNSYVSELTIKVNSAANIEYHSRVITEHSLKRAMITMASTILRDAYEDTTDVFQLLDHTEQSLFRISESNIKKNYADMGTIVRKALDELEVKKNNKDGLTGIPSGFSALDRLTSGWQPSELTILAARPAMGKTAFVVSALRNAAVDFGQPVAIFSLEMSAVQLVNRLISAEAEIDSEKIKKGNLAPHEWTQLHHKIQRLTEAPIFIDDTPALSILELRAKCRRLKAQHDIQMVVIDYLQLMQGDNSKGSNREQEIASISRALKNLAKELNVPVIALSQLSRAVETRGGDKKPQLSDLRESGCLTGDTVLVDATTGKRMTIRELAETNAHNFYTAGTSKNWTVGPERVTHVFHTGKKPVFQLTTRSGRTVKATANHAFLRLTGWYRLDELTVGDHIAVPRRVKVSAATNPLTDNELILLAHLLGDGCVLPKQPYHYTSADEANLAIVDQTAHALFGIQPRRVVQGNWQHTYLPAPYPLTHGVRHPITDWYNRLGLDRVRSYEKRVPEALFTSDESKIALFLHHLWATDGNISWKLVANRKPSAAIYYASSSRQLASDVQHLLLRLGILSTLRTLSGGKNRPMFHVHVQGKEQQKRFLSVVNSYGQRGQLAAELLEALEGITENTNVDVIPKEVWHSVITGCKTDDQISWHTLSERIGMQYAGSTLFKAGVSRGRMTRLHKALPYDVLKHLAESDVLWDEIISIEPVGEEDVYDATVPSVHNFVANDIIVHNSIEQDADMVMFLYRPEYYNITQDEAGNSTAGIGEVIVAKNRSGALDTIQLRFVNRFTKFCDLDTYFEAVPQAQSFPGNVTGLSSFEKPAGNNPPSGPGAMPPLPPTGGTLRSKANDLSNFGNADPNQHTPF